MAREGYKYIVPAIAVTVLSIAVLGNHILTWVAAVLAAVFLQFFRPPPEPADAGGGAILSPAGGFVIEIVEEDEPRFLQARSKRVSIFMTPADVHVNTAPVDGIVRYTDYRPGSFFKADRPEARLQNEQFSAGFERADGMRCMATQVAGWLARRIVCDVRPGDTVRRGRRYGMIEFGSRLDLHLPAAARVHVRPRQHVRAARTILAEV